MFLNDPADTHFGHVDKWLDRRFGERTLPLYPVQPEVIFKRIWVDPVHGQ